MYELNQKVINVILKIIHLKGNNLLNHLSKSLSADYAHFIVEGAKWLQKVLSIVPDTGKQFNPALFFVWRLKRWGWVVNKEIQMYQRYTANTCNEGSSYIKHN